MDTLTDDLDDYYVDDSDENRSCAGRTGARSTRGGRLPYPERMWRDEYEVLKRNLQIELLKLQNWMKESSERLIIVFEGRDAAGKAAPSSASWNTSTPRGAGGGARAPSERETTEWYFQRYVQHLPAAGEIVLFDRSWYNRAVSRT